MNVSLLPCSPSDDDFTTITHSCSITTLLPISPSETSPRLNTWFSTPPTDDPLTLLLGVNDEAVGTDFGESQITTTTQRISAAQQHWGYFLYLTRPQSRPELTLSRCSCMFNGTIAITCIYLSISLLLAICGITKEWPRAHSEVLHYKLLLVFHEFSGHHHLLQLHPLVTQGPICDYLNLHNLQDATIGSMNREDSGFNKTSEGCPWVRHMIMFSATNAQVKLSLANRPP